jgi:alanyl-tRNA synthetase
MPSKKVFWQDPYQTELSTQVQSVDGAVITLAETIFYAFSGGQESDYGSIAGLAVLQAEKRELEIFYTLPPEHGLRAGDTVSVKIDGARRRRLMRLHFAAELVLELIYQKYPGTEKLGAHIAENKARIDFVWPENIAKILPDIQQAAQQIIDTHRPVISAFSDPLTERRYWQIADFSQVPCGGTHIRNTSEIGRLKLKRVNPGQGRERVEIFVEDN